MKKLEIPKKYRDLVGTKQVLQGGIFGRKPIKSTKFEVKDIRWSDAWIVDMKSKKAKHPAFELLVKNDSMRSSRWTRPFPIREIKL